MTVYVDSLRNFGWRLRGRFVRSCHLVADSRDELIAFAVEGLGMKASWLQEKPGQLTHFDLTESRRRKAVLLGAVEISSKELIALAHQEREREIEARRLSGWAMSSEEPS